MTPLRFVVLGLSITSSWRNAHAGTYRPLLRELAARGHDVLFLEREMPQQLIVRDVPRPSFCRVECYASLHDLRIRFAEYVRDADVVMVGSHLQHGAAIGEWVTTTAHGVTVFYDLDTGTTLRLLERNDCPYVTPSLIARYQLYLCSVDGDTAGALEYTYGSPAVRPLYASFNDTIARPEPVAMARDLGCVNAYGDARQSAFERLFIDVARRWPGGRFGVVGPRDPSVAHWPTNVERLAELELSAQRDVYRNQRFTLHVPRVSAGMQLFEAAASGSAIITDDAHGIHGTLRAGEEILIARSARDVLAILVDMPETQRRAIGAAARARVLRDHTPAQRAQELLVHVQRSARAITAA
jgi:spore maturation protein CgeB